MAGEGGCLVELDLHKEAKGGITVSFVKTRCVSKQWLTKQRVIGDLLKLYNSIYF